MPRPSFGLGRLATSPDLHQPVHGVRHRGGVDHQPLADLGHRQLAGLGEGEQHQRLVPRERQSVRLDHRVDLAEQDLLRPHDRGDRGHRGHGPQRRCPEFVGAGDGSKGRLSGLGTHQTLPAGHLAASPVSAFGPAGPGARREATGAADRARHPAAGDDHVHRQELGGESRPGPCPPPGGSSARREQGHRPAAQLLGHGLEVPLVEPEGVRRPGPGEQQRREATGSPAGPRRAAAAAGRRPRAATRSANAFGRLSPAPAHSSPATVADGQRAHQQAEPAEPGAEAVGVRGERAPRATTRNTRAPRRASAQRGTEHGARTRGAARVPPAPWSAPCRSRAGRCRVPSRRSVAEPRNGADGDRARRAGADGGQQQPAEAVAGQLRALRDDPDQGAARARSVPVAEDVGEGRHPGARRTAGRRRRRSSAAPAAHRRPPPAPPSPPRTRAHTRSQTTSDPPGGVAVGDGGEQGATEGVRAGSRPRRRARSSGASR